MSTNTRREIEVWPAKKKRPAFLRRLETKKQKRTFSYSEGSFDGGDRPGAIFWKVLNVRAAKFHGPGTLDIRISSPPVVRMVEKEMTCACGTKKTVKVKELVRDYSSESLMIYPHEARMLLDFLLEVFE